MSRIMFNSSKKKHQTSGILSQCRIVESLEGCTLLTRGSLAVGKKPRTSISNSLETLWNGGTILNKWSFLVELTQFRTSSETRRAFSDLQFEGIFTCFPGFNDDERRNKSVKLLRRWVWSVSREEVREAGNWARQRVLLSLPFVRKIRECP